MSSNPSLEPTMIKNDLIDNVDHELHQKAADLVSVQHAGSVAMEVMANAGEPYEIGSQNGVVPAGKQHLRTRIVGQDPLHFHQELRTLKDARADELGQRVQAADATDPNIKDNQ